MLIDKPTKIKIVKEHLCTSKNNTLEQIVKNRYSNKVLGGDFYYGKIL